jgi:Na+/melibiose symporter-like transporter
MSVECAGKGGTSVTFFMVFGLIGLSAVIFLLWCFRGFSRDLKQGETVGLLVRPAVTQKAVFKQNIQRVVRMSARQRLSSWYGTDVRPVISVTAKSMDSDVNVFSLRKA